jgi:hypothetical protein
MNNATDGNLAAIESYLKGQDDEDECCSGEHRRLAQWLSMKDEERAECLWHHPEAIPDAIRI